MKTIEEILFHIDRVIEEYERDIKKCEAETDRNYGMPAFMRTLRIENYKGRIEAYEEIKKRILMD
jgi:hypothetical protein